MKTLIIIPTLNENENIRPLVVQIMDTLKGYDFSVLFVDDNSTDGTKETIISIKSELDNVYLIQRERKLGLASAYLRGFKFGLKEGFDCFVEMDADFSHNPKYLKNMLEALKNYDFAIGSRNIKGGGSKNWTFVRRMISFFGSIYAQKILNCPIKDLTGGFNGWTKNALEKINLDSIISKGYCFQIEMKYKAFKKGLKYFEFPIIFENRRFGKSKMSMSIFLEAMINVIKIRNS